MFILMSRKKSLQDLVLFKMTGTTATAELIAFSKIKRMFPRVSNRPTKNSRRARLMTRKKKRSISSASNS